MRKIKTKNTLSIVNCPLSIIIAALLIFAVSCGETSAPKQTSPENNAGAMPDQSYVEAWYLDADPLFGKKELKMEWTPKTINGGSMKNIENE